MHRIETAKHFPELQITVSLSAFFSTQRLLASSIGFEFRSSPPPYQKNGCEVVGKKGKSEKCVKVYYSFPNK